MPETSADNKRTNCHRCRFFYITWDQRFPYGCKAMKFKSKTLPYLHVMQESGIPCMMFREKPVQS